MTSSAFSARSVYGPAGTPVSRQTLLEKSRCAERTSVFLVNPLFDLIFVCGGAALALTVLCASVFGADADAAGQSTPIMALGIAGTFLLSGPHTGATLVRLYGERVNRNRHLFVGFILPALLLVALALGLHYPSIAKIEAITYLILVWHHYMAQSYGIAMMYCARAGLNMSTRDKLLPRIILYTAVTLAVTEQFTPAWQRSSFLNIQLPNMAFLPEQSVILLQVLLFAASVILLVDQYRKYRTGNASMPLPALAVLLTNGLFLAFNRSLGDIAWLFLPNLFHATQYLAVVLTGADKAYAETDEQPAIWKRIGAGADRYGVFFLLSFALFTALPFLLTGLGFHYNLANALVFFSLSIHHFAADSKIWKRTQQNYRGA